MNLFRDWMARMGFNGKEVGNAAEAAGIGRRRAGDLSVGKREVDKCERLAMAAVAAGIPEWTPENADLIDRIRRAADAVQGKEVS